MADRLDGIEVFVRAVRLGGLSAAAREMRMSPAMAAKHLSALESRLNVTLVNRTTRRLSLTEAGSAFLEKAEPILAELGEAEAEASARTLAIEGLLRVSAPAAFGMLFLGNLIAEFHQQYPALSIEVGLNDRFVDLLEERWDVAVRIGRLADSSLIAKKLAIVRMSVCASPDYLAAKGTPRALDDLKAHDCLGYTLSPHMGSSTWRFGMDGAIRLPVRGSLHSNNGEVLARAAIAGQGIVYGPRFFTAEALADGRLLEISLDVPLLDMGAVYAVTPAGRKPAAKTRAWIDFLSNRLPGMASEW